MKKPTVNDIYNLIVETVMETYPAEGPNTVSVADLIEALELVIQVTKLAAASSDNKKRDKNNDQ